MKNTEVAFNWIIDIIETEHIPYKISGGFAAKIYGSTRELADIDIEVADEDMLKIETHVKHYISFGPERYRDDDWDLLLMTLEYEGQVIDIAGTNAKIFNKQTKQWEQPFTTLSLVEMKEVFGRIVSVETRDRLIAYKKKLGREVDREDVRQLTTTPPIQ